MKRFLLVLLATLPLLALAEDYQSTLLVQTGKLRESDLVVRTISDLESNKICLAFYVRTVGTSPVLNCFDAVSGFRSRVKQSAHFKEGKLVVRKITESLNGVSCLVAYVSTAGTSPSIDCYQQKMAVRDDIVREGHLREGDLDVYRIVDAENARVCLVTYVNTGSTSPSLVCYQTHGKTDMGSLDQTSLLKEGDLVVRKILDRGSNKECLVTYVSTEGTSPSVYCDDLHSAARGPGPAAPGNHSFRPMAPPAGDK